MALYSLSALASTCLQGFSGEYQSEAEPDYSSYEQCRSLPLASHQAHKRWTGAGGIKILMEESQHLLDSVELLFYHAPQSIPSCFACRYQVRLCLIVALRRSEGGKLHDTENAESSDSGQTFDSF